MMPRFINHTGKSISIQHSTRSNPGCVCVCARNEGLIGMMGLL